MRGRLEVPGLGFRVANGKEHGKEHEQFGALGTCRVEDLG